MKSKLSKLVKKLITKKEDGVSELFVSLVVLVALTTLVLIYVLSIGDIQTKIQIDQVARKYILRMETTGSLSSSDRDSLIKELKAINAVKKTGKEPIVNASTGSSYGQAIYLDINCPAMVTGFSWSDNDVFGKISHSRESNYIVRKQSIAKY